MSSSEEVSWISWFCGLRGNEFFCEVSPPDYSQTGILSKITGTLRKNNHSAFSCNGGLYVSDHILKHRSPSTPSCPGCQTAAHPSVNTTIFIQLSSFYWMVVYCMDVLYTLSKILHFIAVRFLMLSWTLSLFMFIASNFNVWFHFYGWNDK